MTYELILILNFFIQYINIWNIIRKEKHNLNFNTKLIFVEFNYSLYLIKIYKKN